MKKVFFFLAMLLFSIGSYANISPISEDNVELTQQLSIDDILNLESVDIEQKINRKLRLKDKVALNFAKRQIKKSQKKGIDNETIERSLKEGDFSMDWGSFFLGFLLGLIGLLLVYLIKDGDKVAMKSAIYGLLVAVIFTLTIYLLAALLS